MFLRTVNHNPIGYHVRNTTGKHPKDLRTPPAIELYNDVVRQVSASFKDVTLLDMEHIVRPLFDAARDWCHYDNVVGRALGKVAAMKICEDFASEKAYLARGKV